MSERSLRSIFPSEPSAYYLRNSRINQHGFPSEHADYLGDPEGFHVGIFGGSVARIPGMRARGVAVLDLSQLFAGSTEDLYRDPCCHYNLRGNQLLADAVAEALLAREGATVGARLRVP